MPLEKQKKVLSYAEELRQQNGGEGSRVEDLTIWEMVKDGIVNLTQGERELATRQKESRFRHLAN